jgi:2,3-bisphosphoglycerate-independent phosphoglycerate mutase
VAIRINLVRSCSLELSPDSSKAIYVLLDGVGDLPHPLLGGLTPLEAARTPYLDQLTSGGCLGSVISVGKGIAPQSDIAVFNMLGYDFKDIGYPGRGIIEALGMGMDFRNGDLVLRGNFATVDEQGNITDRRAGRIIEYNEALEVCRTLQKSLKFTDNISTTLQPSIGHRVIVKFSSPSLPLSRMVTNTDPAYGRIDGIGVARDTSNMKIQESVPEEGGNSAATSARTINEFSNQVAQILANHPVNSRRIAKGLKPMNAILLRDSGNHLPAIEPIAKRYGLEFGSVVDMPVEIGISRLLGMHYTTGGDIDAYQEKAAKCIDQIEKWDIVYVHIKGPDEFGHDGDPIGKKTSIEQIDDLFFGALVKNLDISKTMLIVSGDHSTPCIMKAHTDDPIPVLFTGGNVEKDESRRFTEKESLIGSRGLMKGTEILPFVTKTFLLS